MICKAIEKNIETLLEITSACAKHMITKGIFQWNEFYPNRKAFEEDIKREELYVYKIEQQVIACVAISNKMDEEYKAIDWLTKNKNNLYVHRLAVHPQYQGMGIARKLMDFAEEKARLEKKASIRLDTFSQNKRNQKFYEQRGYKRLGNVFFPRQSEFPFYCYELAL